MGIRKSFTYEGQRHFIRAADLTDYEVKKALLIQELESGRKIESSMLSGTGLLNGSRRTKQAHATTKPTGTMKRGWKNISCLKSAISG